MNEATNALGAAMRKEAETNGYCTRDIVTLVLRLTHYGNDWALELNDETPIDPETAQVWVVAVGAPGGTAFRKAYNSKVWRFTWQDESDPAPDTLRAFYLHGGKS